MKQFAISKIILALFLICAMLTGCGTSTSSDTTAQKDIGGAAKATNAVTTAPEATESEEENTEPETETPTDNEDSASEESEVESVTLTDASGDFTYTGEVKWIGDESHGYIQIPADYSVFVDVDVDGLIQYCNGPYNIVTLQYFEGTSADTAAANLYAHFQEEDEITELTGANVTISDYSATQIYGYYTASAQYLVIWLIADPDDENSCYYLAMEYDEEHSDIVACSSTFTPHHN